MWIFRSVDKDPLQACSKGGNQRIGRRIKGKCWRRRRRRIRGGCFIAPLAIFTVPADLLDGGADLMNSLIIAKQKREKQATLWMGQASLHSQRGMVWKGAQQCTMQVFLVQVTLSTDNRGYMKVPFPCFPRLVNPLGVHPEVKCFLLNCSSKNFFTGNYCSKLSVKLISAIYNHNPYLTPSPIFSLKLCPTLRDFRQDSSTKRTTLELRLAVV